MSEVLNNKDPEVLATSRIQTNRLYLLNSLLNLSRTISEILSRLIKNHAFIFGKSISIINSFINFYEIRYCS